LGVGEAYAGVLAAIGAGQRLWASFFFRDRHES
jgi:hypothetical protein